MVTHNVISVLFVLSITCWQSSGITNKRSFMQYGENVRNYQDIVGPPSTTDFTDWEIGLRESVNQALLREGYHDPNLRVRLLRAPIIGKQHAASPFGDVVLLARGQLFALNAGNFAFVQDPYSNDCDECHNAKRFGCRTNRCRDWRDQHQRNLIALWTVKRLRHRSFDNYQYEIQYTISPMTSSIDEEFVTRDGEYDYSMPGHVFIIKNDNVYKNHPTESYIEVYNKKHYNDHYKPEVLLEEDQHGHKHFLHSYPGFFTSIPIHSMHHQDLSTNDPREVDLYKKLIETLSQKTSTTVKEEGPQRITFPHLDILTNPQYETHSTTTNKMKPTTTAQLNHSTTSFNHTSIKPIITSQTTAPQLSTENKHKVKTTLHYFVPVGAELMTEKEFVSKTSTSVPIASTRAPPPITTVSTTIVPAATITQTTVKEFDELEFLFPSEKTTTRKIVTGKYQPLTTMTPSTTVSPFTVQKTKPSTKYTKKYTPKTTISLQNTRTKAVTATSVIQVSKAEASETSVHEIFTAKGTTPSKSSSLIPFSNSTTTESSTSRTITKFTNAIKLTSKSSTKFKVPNDNTYSSPIPSTMESYTMKPATKTIKPIQTKATTKLPTRYSHTTPIPYKPTSSRTFITPTRLTKISPEFGTKLTRPSAGLARITKVTKPLQVSREPPTPQEKSMLTQITTESIVKLTSEFSTSTKRTTTNTPTTTPPTTITTTAIPTSSPAFSYISEMAKETISRDNITSIELTKPTTTTTQQYEIDTEHNITPKPQVTTPHQIVAEDISTVDTKPMEYSATSPMIPDITYPPITINTENLSTAPIALETTSPIIFTSTESLFTTPMVPENTSPLSSVTTAITTTERPQITSSIMTGIETTTTKMYDSTQDLRTTTKNEQIQTMEQTTSVVVSEISTKENTNFSTVINSEKTQTLGSKEMSNTETLTTTMENPEKQITKQSTEFETTPATEEIYLADNGTEKMNDITKPIANETTTERLGNTEATTHLTESTPLFNEVTSSRVTEIVTEESVATPNILTLTDEKTVSNHQEIDSIVEKATTTTIPTIRDFLANDGSIHEPIIYVKPANKQDYTDEDIFGTTKYTRKPTKTTSKMVSDSDFAQQLFRKTRKNRNRKRTRDSSKIIYSNFYAPSTAATPTTDVTTQALLTRQSVKTSISFEVNKRKNNRTKNVESPITTMKDINNKNNKLELSIVNTKTAFDNLAVEILNHARTIDYFNQIKNITSRPKYKRRKMYNSKLKRNSRRKQ